MKHRHLVWLVPALAGMVAVRVLDDSQPADTGPASAALVRTQRQKAGSAHAGAAASRAVATPDPLLVAGRSPEPEPIDAFVVRVPVAASPARASAPAVNATKAFAGPPQPPMTSAAAMAPAPPIQVIGTWLDAQGPSVFLANGARTVQVRTGEVVFMDYKIQQIQSTQVLLRQLSTQREFYIPVPLVTGSPSRP